jgi:outer membrane lipase/esterase
MDTPHAGIVVFGDSLSDPGNKHAVTGLANRPPYDLLDDFLIPDGPYTKGGLHHSNGATWVEQYAQPLGLGRDVRPAYQGNDPVEILPCVPPTTNKHLGDQVTDFLADVNLSPSSGALYSVFIGGNDVADAVKALLCDDTAASSAGIVVRALQHIAEAIGGLYGTGARQFLVVNSPDVGLIPAFNPPLNSIPGVSDVATCFSLLFNLGTITGDGLPNAPAACGFPSGIPGLVDILNDLALLPGIEIIRYDVFSKFVQLVNAPMDGEPQNGQYACVMPDTPPYSCKDPDDYVFWDGTHPTKAVHSILAEEIGAMLAE